MIIQDVLDYLTSIHVNYSFLGDPNEEILGFSSLRKYREGTMTWVKNESSIQNADSLFSCTLIITGYEVTGKFRNVIHTENPKFAFFTVIEHFFSEDEEKPLIGEHTYISPSVKLGKNVRIGHNCTLDGKIEIGDDTVIWNGVTIINRVRIGSRCEIQSGTVIGHDGFGYTEDETHKKTMIKHFGGVEIGNDVRIGMNNVIARGVIDDTVIGSGTKIADLTHIGHNNTVGENCTIINSALFGSCVTGDNAYIVYSVVKNQTKIGENAFVGMSSNVIRDVPAGAVVFGNPAKPKM